MPTHKLALSFLTLALTLASATTAAGPNREIAVPGTDPSLPFSPAVRTGDLVFLSGKIGNLPGTRKLAEGGIAGQTRQALENINATLAAIELGLEDVVKCTVFLDDLEDYAKMNEVYAQFFPTNPPARSTVGVQDLVLDAKIEIECIAAARSTSG